MRKLVYYKSSSPGRQPKRRKSQNSPSLARPLAILFVFAGMLLSAGYFVYKAAPVVKGKIENFQENGYSAWNFKTVEVSGLAPEETKAVLDQILFSPGQSVSTEDCKKLAQDLASKIINIKDIRVKRGLFSGKLRISAKPRVAVGQLATLSAIKQGFDDDGVIYPIPADSKLPFIIIRDDEGKVPQKVSKEIVQLVDAVKVFERELGFSNLTVDKDAKNARIFSEDKTEIVLGPSVNFEAQAKAASKILKYTQGRYKKPFELNFEYFSDGKVYLKEI
ncbi:cell division septal protein FtsQ [Elusimicrobium posterum]|uniref:hypothetical protein n=1 Tax=Elusimicrobium posterum TaxID=3116653 RepID=UPI003C789EFE